MTDRINQPELKEHQFALLVVEAATGIICNTELTWYLSDGKEVYFVFDSLEETKDFISRLEMDTKKYEFIIYDKEYQILEVS